MENRKVKTLLSFLYLFILLSCSRDIGDISRVKIQLPKSLVPQFSQKNNILAAANGPDWNSSLDPTNINEVNCYAIFVGGPEAFLNQNSCSRTDTGVVQFRFGISRFFLPAGQAVEIVVPSGNDREIIVAGFKTQNGSCFETSPGGIEPDFANMSFPHIVSRQTVDLVPGDVNLTMIAQLDSNKLFNDCDFIEGGDDGGGGGGNSGFIPDYGDGTEDKMVTTLGSTTDGVTGQFCDTGECGAYGMIDAVVDNGSGFDLSMVTIANANTFSIGDEVIAMVMDAGGTNGPDGHCGGGPGDAFIGAQSTHTVTSVSGGSNVVGVSGSSSMLSLVATQPSSILQVNGGGNFCYIQLIKVVHLNSLTIGAGIELTAPNFDNTNDGGGGVIALRIKDHLTFQSDTSKVSASGDGHRPSSGTSSGFGHGGVTAGFAGSSGIGGGGGGHMGPSSFSAPSGGDGGNNPGSAGQAVIENCSSNGFQCTSFDKVLLGGSGGSNGVDTPSGSGGGIIMISAKNININGSSEAMIEASGENASTATSMGGAGGGAGGYIELFTETVTDGKTLKLQANGGSGSNANSGDGGGGGSGGFVGLAACPGVHDNVSYSFTGGSGGVQSSGTQDGASGQSGAHLQSGLDDSINCPAALFVQTSKGEIDFGHVNISTSHEQTVTIENAGEQDATTVTSTLSGNFTFKGGSYPGTGGTCGSTILANSSCTVVIAYNSSAASVLDTVPLILNYNDGLGSVSSSANIVGKAQLGELVITGGPEFDYGSITNSTTTSNTFVVTNVGFGSAISFGNFQPSVSPFGYKGGSFPGTAGDCGSSLSPGASCNIEVEFAPVSLGPHSGFISIDYNNQSSSETVSIGVKGESIP